LFDIESQLETANKINITLLLRVFLSKKAQNKAPKIQTYNNTQPVPFICLYAQRMDNVAEYDLFSGGRDNDIAEGQSLGLREQTAFCVRLSRRRIHSALFLSCFCCWFADERSLKQHSMHLGSHISLYSAEKRAFHQTVERNISLGFHFSAAAAAAMLTGVELFFERC
jgi:hypothetical protein